MTTVNGTMATDRPERYAKQLVSHWSERGPVSTESGAGPAPGRCSSAGWSRPTDGALEVEVTVPDGDDAARFAQVVKAHLERFGQRDEVNVVWHL